MCLAPSSRRRRFDGSNRALHPPQHPQFHWGRSGSSSWKLPLCKATQQVPEAPHAPHERRVSAEPGCLRREINYYSSADKPSRLNPAIRSQIKPSCSVCISWQGRSSLLGASQTRAAGAACWERVPAAADPAPGLLLEGCRGGAGVQPGLQHNQEPGLMR